MGIATVRVSNRIVEPKFFDQTGLAGTGTLTMNIGSHDVHFNFTRSVSSQNRAVLQ